MESLFIDFYFNLLLIIKQASVLLKNNEGQNRHKGNVEF